MTPDPTVVYSAAEARHAAAILEIERLCFAVPWSEASIEAEFEDNLAHYFISSVGESIVGYCGYWRILDEAHITNIAVHPDYRGRGIGAGLLGVMLADIEADGIHAVTLEVREGNTPALKLYEAFGFETAGIRKNYYQKEKKNAIIMWKHG